VRINVKNSGVNGGDNEQARSGRPWEPQCTLDYPRHVCKSHSLRVFWWIPFAEGRTEIVQKLCVMCGCAAITLTSLSWTTTTASSSTSRTTTRGKIAFVCYNLSTSTQPYWLRLETLLKNLNNDNKPQASPNLPRFDFGGKSMLPIHTHSERSSTLFNRTH